MYYSHKSNVHGCMASAHLYLCTYFHTFKVVDKNVTIFIATNHKAECCTAYVTSQLKKRSIDHMHRFKVPECTRAHGKFQPIYDISRFWNAAYLTVNSSLDSSIIWPSSFYACTCCYTAWCGEHPTIGPNQGSVISCNWRCIVEHFTAKAMHRLLHTVTSARNLVVIAHKSWLRL